MIVTIFALITKAERSIFIRIRDYIFGALVFPIGTVIVKHTRAYLEHIDGYAISSIIRVDIISTTL